MPRYGNGNRGDLLSVPTEHTDPGTEVCRQSLGLLCADCLFWDTWLTCEFCEYNPETQGDGDEVGDGRPLDLFRPWGGLSQTVWGDVVLFRGDGLYFPDSDGILTVCGDVFRPGSLWIDSGDMDSHSPQTQKGGHRT